MADQATLLDVADITVADVTQSNGVIQVIDHVLLP